MYTYQILIEYVGTNFVGWQIQKNGHSVQEILQKNEMTKMTEEEKTIELEG